MKSRITIEVDFNNGNQPVIQILQTASDDVRDSLLQAFTQQFGGSSWCKIKWINQFDDGSGNAVNRIHISPLPDTQFKEQAAIMLEQDRLNKEFLKKSKAS